MLVIIFKNQSILLVIIKTLQPNENTESDISNALIKSEVKKEAGVDASKLAKKVDSAGLKLDVDKLDSEKLKTITVNLNKLKSEVYRLDVVKLKTLISFDLKNLSSFFKK